MSDPILVPLLFLLQNTLVFGLFFIRLKSKGKKLTDYNIKHIRIRIPQTKTSFQWGMTSKLIVQIDLF